VAGSGQECGTGNRCTAKCAGDWGWSARRSQT